MIIITASLEDAVRDRAIELGVVSFMTKPFRIFELTQCMRAALRSPSVDEHQSTPHTRLRRKRADALLALPSPSTLRSRLQREIEACIRDQTTIVCAVVRLEEEERLSAQVGRSSTDALLGAAVIALTDLIGEKMVRGDIDEVVAMLPEHHLAALALIATKVGGEDRVNAGIALEHQITLRWGAKIADPRQIDAERLLTEARAAVDKAHRAGEPGSIARSSPSPDPSLFLVSHSTKSARRGS